MLVYKMEHTFLKIKSMFLNFLSMFPKYNY